VQLLGLTHNSILVSIVMLGEVEAWLSADGAVAEEGRARAEVLLRTWGGSSLVRKMKQM
jgi:hypothetical protein